MNMTLRALRQLFFLSGFQAQALEPLPEDLVRMDPCDAQVVLKEPLLAEPFDGVEVGFFLEQKAHRVLSTSPSVICGCLSLLIL
jgi:hypothetical protein